MDKRAAILLTLILGGCSAGTSVTAPAPAPGAGAGACTPGEADRAMLDAVNEARASARNCGDTAYPAAPALAWSCPLARAAARHSADMAANDFSSHTGSDGLGVADRVTAAGYDWSAVGENIAGGYPDVAAVMQSWLDSPGHCGNLMNPDFTELGAASANNTVAEYGIYWTQVFGRPRP